MTEDQWATAEDMPIYLAVAQLGPRRQRLLAVALVRSLRWTTGDILVAALDASEKFADTGKTKAALKRAREALQNARLELGDPRADPAAWAANEGVFLTLWTASVACSENAVTGALREAARALREGDGLSLAGARRVLYPVFREVAGPDAPVAFSPSWRTDTAVLLARQMYESRDFSAMPILADALQDAGCDNDTILSHCRDTNQVHVRGCWVVDLVLGKS
jgi:hypothetical protein